MVIEPLQVGQLPFALEWNPAYPSTPTGLPDQVATTSTQHVYLLPAIEQLGGQPCAVVLHPAAQARDILTGVEVLSAK